MTTQEYKHIGKPFKLTDGLEKVTGYARYVADLELPGMVIGKPIFSPYAHAEIIEIDKSEAEQMPGVVAVLTAEDMPTRDRTITSRNSAILAKGRVLWVGQPVAIVVAETAQQAADALDFVYIDYAPLPATIDLLAAIKADSPTLWPHGLPRDDEDLGALHGETTEAVEVINGALNNVSAENSFSRGDVETAFSEADAIVERRYTTASLHQMYMEPHAVIADPDPLGRNITIYTSTQGKFQVRGEVAKLLNMAVRNVLVEPMTFGGGFGAKYGILEPLTAATALAVRRPVKIVFTRSEDMLATTPAPQMIIDLKLAAKDGKVSGLKGRVLTDNGVFGFGHGGLAAMMMGGYYKCDNVHIDTYEVHTNTAPVGAYRAPGAPQATFAIESSIDELAEAIGVDKLAFRLDNAAEAGDMMGINRPWPSIGYKQCLERLAAHPIMQEPLGENEGLGFAGGGWPTAVSPSEAVCRVDSDGTVIIETGNVDVTGNSASFALIAAETLGVEPENVVVKMGNTEGPYAPGSGGSQVTYSVAGSVKESAENARTNLLKIAADEFEAAADDIELANGQAYVKGVPDKTLSIGKLAGIARNKRGGDGPIVGEGRVSVKENAPAFTVHAVKVRVNPDTGEVTPLRYVAIQDVGFALNPLMVTGQMHGGMGQSLGMALLEATVYDENGQLLSGSLLDYGMPQIDQVPDFEAVFVENASPHGPFGARGIGEPPIIGGPAAIANAIKNATGARIDTLPLSAERIWRALHA